MSEPPRQDGFPATAGARIGPGVRVAGYRVEDELGRGGMGVVFRARDEQLGRTVALKVLAPELAADESLQRWFLRESQAAAAVDDPHIISVFQAGEVDGVLFIAMRFVPGGDVRSLLRREGPLPAGRAAGIIAQVASALDAAHGAGLVHRDVKPANMLLDARPGRSDHVYLSDFGLSEGALSSAGRSGSGLFLGTPDYVSPEQIEGHVLDGRADQYALACAAFELLSGKPPFARDHHTAVIHAHLNEPPPALTSLRPDLPTAADVVLRRALAKAPAGRFPSCGEFAEALHAALDVLPYDTETGTSQDERPETIAATTTPVALGPSPGQTGTGGTETSDSARIVTSPATRNEAASGAAARHAAGSRTHARPGEPALTATSPGPRPGPSGWAGGRRGRGPEPPAVPPSQAGRVTGSGSKIRGRRRAVLAAPRHRVIIAAGAGIAAISLITVISIVTSPSTSHRGIAESPSTHDRSITASPSTSRPVGWTYTTISAVESSPAVVGGIVYVGSDDDNVYALDAATGHVRWTYTTGGAVGSPAVAGDTVYVASGDGRLYALDAATGHLRWTYTTGDTVGSPAVAGSTVYICGDEVDALDAATGHVRWTYNVGGSACSPSVVGDTFYVGIWGLSAKVYALDAATGHLRWTYAIVNVDPEVASISAVVGGTVYIGVWGSEVDALDAASGQLRWTYTIGGSTASIGSNPAVADGTVYIGCNNDKVYALDAATGHLRWTYTTGFSVDSTPAVADGTVYFGSEDDKVYALDAATGHVRWTYTTGGPVDSSPAVVGGTVYIGSDDNKVYALDASTGLP